MLVNKYHLLRLCRFPHNLESLNSAILEKSWNISVLVLNFLEINELSWKSLKCAGSWSVMAKQQPVGQIRPSSKKVLKIFKKHIICKFSPSKFTSKRDFYLFSINNISTLNTEHVCVFLSTWTAVTVWTVTSSPVKENNPETLRFWSKLKETCLSLCLCVCLSLSLSVCVSVCLSVCLSSGSSDRFLKAKSEREVSSRPEVQERQKQQEQRDLCNSRSTRWALSLSLFLSPRWALSITLFLSLFLSPRWALSITLFLSLFLSPRWALSQPFFNPSCSVWPQTVYKDGWRVSTSPTVQKWSQNIPDTGAAILSWWRHLEPDSAQ